MKTRGEWRIVDGRRVWYVIVLAEKDGEPKDERRTD